MKNEKVLLEDMQPVTRAEIEDAVRRVGVQAGDVLLVHSSLSRLGRVDGGAEAVIESLRHVVGPDGLLIMPVFTSTYVNSRKPGEREPFDPAATSCRRRTGVVPETFRRMPGVRRSLHPTHSLAALGPRADEFVEGGEMRTFDAAGPFGRYVRWGGRALFLGVHMGANTTYHCAEEWMGLPFLQTVPVLVQGPAGVETVDVTGSPQGCRAYYGGGGEPSQRMEEAGYVHRVMLNQSEIRLVSARDVVRFCCESEEQQPGFLLCRGTPHDFCREGLDASLRHRDATLERISRLRAGGIECSEQDGHRHAGPYVSAAGPDTWPKGRRLKT